MKANKIIDANLVKQLQSGNTAAFAVLVKRWHKKFCKKAYWIVKDAEQSKDIAQESWKTIIIKIGDLKDPSSFSGWAMRIVYTKSLDAIRETNKNRVKEDNYAREQTADAEKHIDKSQIKKELLKAIRNLSQDHQMVVKLFYVDDYSLKQISETLKISVGTAKSRLFHARENLKLILKHKNYEN